MKKFINYNGRIYEEGQAVGNIADHSYRYGDGLFETMKGIKGTIMFKEDHFERLYSGLKILRIDVPALFTKQNIEDQVADLCRKNDCMGLARIRLSLSRGSGGLYDCDNKFSYGIECWPLEKKGFNENGLAIDIFPDARKSIDAFSNLKSANYLPYVMAAVWAKENKLDDALVLNQHDRICDATIANIFWIKGNRIYTPPLSEGCVKGVMRKQILDLSPDSYGDRIADWRITESCLSEDILLDADEVFLTNVTTGIRWIGQIGNKQYTNKITAKLFAELNPTISS